MNETSLTKLREWRERPAPAPAGEDDAMARDAYEARRGELGALARSGEADDTVMMLLQSMHDRDERGLTSLAEDVEALNGTVDRLAGMEAG